MKIIAANNEGQFDDLIKKLEDLTQVLEANSADEVENVIKEFIYNPALSKSIFDFLSKANARMAKEARKVFTFLTHLFEQLSGTRTELQVAVKPFYRHILTQNSNVLLFFLQSKVAAVVKSILTFLISLCELGPSVVQKFMANVDLFSPELKKVSERRDGMDDDDVRTTYITLVCAILKNGDIVIRRQLVQHRGFLNEILLGLRDDNAIAITRLLTTLRRCVVEDKDVPKTTKQRLFSPHVLKTITKLYQWKGPKLASWLAKAVKRKRDADPPESNYRSPSKEEQLRVNEVVGSILKSLLCPEHPQHGIVVLNPPMGSSLNHIALTCLRELPQAHNNPDTRNLVVSVLRASPNQIPAYYELLQDALEPRPTKAWCNAMRLLCDILAAIDPVSMVLQVSSAKEGARVQADHIVSLCLPHKLFPASSLSSSLSTGDPVICQWLLIYIKVVLSKLQMLAKTTAHTLVDSLRTTFQDNLVSIEDLLETWNSLIVKSCDKPQLILALPIRLKLLLKILVLYTGNLYCKQFNLGPFLKDISALKIRKKILFKLHLLIVELGAVNMPQLMQSPVAEKLPSPTTLLKNAICFSSTSAKAVTSCIEKVLTNLAHLPEEDVQLLTKTLLENHRNEVVCNFLMSLMSAPAEEELDPEIDLDTFLVNGDFSCVEQEQDQPTTSIQDRAKEYAHTLEGQDKKVFRSFYKKIKKSNIEEQPEEEAMKCEELQQPLSCPLVAILEKHGLGELDLEGKKSTVRKALAPVWQDFVKDCLKKGLSPDPTDLAAAASVLAGLHSACRKFYSKESSTAILAPSKLRSMVMGHSQFQSLFCAPHSPCKESLLDLLLLLCSLDTEGLSEKHIPLFLTGYRATLSPSDQKIFRLLILYNSNGVDLEPYSPFFWGFEALSHYQRVLAVDDNAASINNIFELLNEEKLALTIRNFPLTLDMEQSMDQDALYEVENGETIYDPRFLLRIFKEMLDVGQSKLWTGKFVHTGCLGLVFAALSSQQKSVQDCAVVCLSRLAAHIENDPKLELWHYLLSSLSLSGRLPCILTQLLARLPTILSNPQHPLYHYMKKTFSSQNFNLKLFREFYLLYRGNNPNLEETEEWVLTLLLEGLRTPMDFDLCQKQHIFELLHDRITSPLYSKFSKKLAVKILGVAAAIPGKKDILSQQLNLDLLWRIVPDMKPS